jgi:hypothetical protein
MRPGDRVPSHRDLARRFGVSLVAARDALVQAEREGLVEIRPRSGAFVRAAGRDLARSESDHVGAFPLRIVDGHPLHLCHARVVLEVETAAQAVLRGRPEDLPPVREALDRWLRARAAGDDQAEVEGIRPTLVKYCYKCHSSATTEPKGGLRLDSREGIRKGGDSGAAVVPSDVGGSLLIEALRHESIEMPPGKREAARGATGPRASGRCRGAPAAPLVRAHRPAPRPGTAGGVFEGIRRRSGPGHRGAGRRPTGLAALRRAFRAALDGRGPLRRHLRLRAPAPASPASPP